MHESRLAVTALLFLLVIALLDSSAQAQSANPLRQALGAGAYFAEGNYGEPESTEILYFPLSYEADRGQWGFRLLVPWLEVTGLGNVLVNLGGITRAVAGTQRVTERGLGDVVASLVYRVEPFSDGAPFIDLRVDAKLPTADESKNLGTGETDYSVQVDLSQNVANSVVFATIGRNFRGKSSIYPGLQDSTFLQLGLARSIASNWNAGIFYDYRQAASDFSDESHELVPYITWQMTERWSFTALTTLGFTDASPDYSLLGQLSYRW